MGRIAQIGHNYCNKIARREHRKAEDRATATTATPATIQQKRAERQVRRRQLSGYYSTILLGIVPLACGVSGVVGTEIV